MKRKRIDDDEFSVKKKRKIYVVTYDDLIKEILLVSFENEKNLIHLNGLQEKYKILSFDEINVQTILRFAMDHFLTDKLKMKYLLECYNRYYKTKREELANPIKNGIINYLRTSLYVPNKLSEFSFLIVSEFSQKKDFSFCLDLINNLFNIKEKNEEESIRNIIFKIAETLGRYFQSPEFSEKFFKEFETYLEPLILFNLMTKHRMVCELLCSHKKFIPETPNSNKEFEKSILGAFFRVGLLNSHEKYPFVINQLRVIKDRKKEIQVNPLDPLATLKTLNSFERDAREKIQDEIRKKTNAIQKILAEITLNFFRSSKLPRRKIILWITLLINSWKDVMRGMPFLGGRNMFNSPIYYNCSYCVLKLFSEEVIDKKVDYRKINPFYAKNSKKLRIGEEKICLRPEKEGMNPQTNQTSQYNEYVTHMFFLMMKMLHVGYSPYIGHLHVLNDLVDIRSDSENVIIDNFYVERFILETLLNELSLNSLLFKCLGYNISFLMHTINHGLKENRIRLSSFVTAEFLCLPDFLITIPVEHLSEVVFPFISRSFKEELRIERKNYLMMKKQEKNLEIRKRNPYFLLCFFEYFNIKNELNLNNFVNLMILMLDNFEYSKPSIRAKFAELFLELKVFLPNVADYYSFACSDNLPSHYFYSITNNPIVNEFLMKILINFFIRLDAIKTDVYALKIKPRNHIALLVDNCLKSDRDEIFRKNFSKVFLENKSLFVKFFSYFIEDTTKIFDETMEIIKTVSELEKELDEKKFNEREKREKTEELVKNRKNIKFQMRLLILNVELLKEITSKQYNLQKNFLTSEMKIKYRLCDLIDHGMTKLIRNKNNYHIRNPLKVLFTPNNLVVDLAEICTNFYEYKMFIRTMGSAHDYEDDKFETLKQVVLSFQLKIQQITKILNEKRMNHPSAYLSPMKLSSRVGQRRKTSKFEELTQNKYKLGIVLERFTKYMNIIKKYYEKRKKVDFPDEFFDPIFCNVMDNPVLLPHPTDRIFVDRSTIEIRNNENPYTNTPMKDEEIVVNEDFRTKIRNFWKDHQL